MGDVRGLTVIVDDLVVDFAEFAAQVPRADVVTGWRERVVEPRADLYRAVEPWLDPADAPANLPRCSAVARNSSFAAGVRRWRSATFMLS
ncbi:MAG TPA: hypothetical protein VGJ95_06665 [Pseudonocardiaceae bacterium]